MAANGVSKLLKPEGHVIRAHVQAVYHQEDTIDTQGGSYKLIQLDQVIDDGPARLYVKSTGLSAKLKSMDAGKMYYPGGIPIEIVLSELAIDPNGIQEVRNKGYAEIVYLDSLLINYRNPVENAADEANPTTNESWTATMRGAFVGEAPSNFRITLEGAVSPVVSTAQASKTTSSLYVVEFVKVLKGSS